MTTNSKSIGGFFAKVGTAVTALGGAVCLLNVGQLAIPSFRLAMDGTWTQTEIESGFTGRYGEPLMIGGIRKSGIGFKHIFPIVVSRLTVSHISTRKDGMACADSFVHVRRFGNFDHYYSARTCLNDEDNVVFREIKPIDIDKTAAKLKTEQVTLG
jgi:hypothetical protein